jgi:hypothetical protein
VCEYESTDTYTHAPLAHTPNTCARTRTTAGEQDGERWRDGYTIGHFSNPFKGIENLTEVKEKLEGHLTVRVALRTAT